MNFVALSPEDLYDLSDLFDPSDQSTKHKAQSTKHSLNIKPHFHFPCDRRKARIIIARLKSQLAFYFA